MNKTLDDFHTAEQRQEIKQEKQQGKKDFMVRWNVTKEDLTDRYGNIISDRITTKAMKFIEGDCLHQILKADDEGTETWECRPIEGYNITVYTMQIRHTGEHLYIGCNCQWSTMHNKLCSHALALLITKELTGVRRTVRGGVRGIKPKRVYQEH